MRSFMLLAAALAMPALAQETSPVWEWIASHAIRLTTPVAGHGFADMQPLKSVIGNARIVLLGEATHGTREFFQLKHRMLEFLATEMGFTIFSIEANMPEAYKLNDYVLHGQGDPAVLLKGMYFWTWDTEEVLDMIRWMREFNQSGKGRVEFTGFDMQTPTVAGQNVADFVAKTDAVYAATVKSANAVAQETRQVQPGPNFGVATGTFPVSVAAGKTIRFSGYIKTADAADGWAGLWWRVDGPSGVLAFDNMQSRGVTGTTGWKEYAIELPVAANATNINFGALFPGSGTAWFDDFKVELDGKPYEDPSLFDFGFESPSPRGFYTGGAGYRVELDSEVFHGGKQSLRMRRVSSQGTAKDAVDPQAAAQSWRDIIAHLQDSREAYRLKGATEPEIDWAIQNARVVLQCLEMRANQVTRDQSMADNVKWIADHSPGAKIVVWAHNGHVGQTSTGAYNSMGAALRKMFGGQMVVFGFAFNQGSFQAISQSKHVLKDFTVPAAPAGSLDAVLAAAGIPLFALDLRQLPASGPVADWWREPHSTRSIGAVYPEDSPYAFMTSLKAPQTFDALLFVSNTTAAHKNPGAGERAQAAPAAPPSAVAISWNRVLRVSNTTPSLQVVVNPPLRRGSAIHDRVFQALHDLQPDYARFVPWLPYPRLAVAELEPPRGGVNHWVSSLIDPLTEDFLEATKGHPVVLNFSTTPQWMWVTPQPIAYPANPDEPTWNYTQGAELRDPTGKELADYYARLAAWYTRGGFDDEKGIWHKSGYRYNIDWWEVLNEPDLEHHLGPKRYTEIYDAIVTRLHVVAPGMKFVGVSLAGPSRQPEMFQYFLDPRNHKPGVPLDAISYHFYASPATDEPPDAQQFTFWDQAEGFLNTVRYVDSIRRRLSPKTATMINEVGAISADDRQQNQPGHVTKPIPNSYWNLTGAMYAYLFGECANLGIETINASQLVGYPTQFPSVSLVNWENGQPNARFWVLKLLRDHFGPGDKLVGTSQPGPCVYAQAFVTRNGRRSLLLVNRRNREIEIRIPQAEGATMQFVDQTTAFDPPASTTLSSDTVKLAGYAVAVVEFR